MMGNGNVWIQRVLRESAVLSKLAPGNFGRKQSRAFNCVPLESSTPITDPEDLPSSVFEPEVRQFHFTISMSCC